MTDPWTTLNVRDKCAYMDLAVEIFEGASKKARTRYVCCRTGEIVGCPEQTLMESLAGWVARNPERVTEARAAHAIVKGSL